MENQLGSSANGGNGGGGLHIEIWGSLIGVIVLVCCVVTFYKYWCGQRASNTEVIQIIRK